MVAKGSKPGEPAHIRDDDDDHKAWRPLNGSSLVIANPPQAAQQAYRRLVLSDLSLLSFADYVGLDRTPRDAHHVS